MKFEIHWAISGVTEVDADTQEEAQMMFDTLSIETLARLDGDLEQLGEPVPIEGMASLPGA